MTFLSPEKASSHFASLLTEACSQVSNRWFLLPVSAADARVEASAYRERVYCYELYHQIRVLSQKNLGKAAGAPDYVLSGEIDKAGLNAVIPNGKEKPDLVWHIPGEWQNNAVVVEVKPAENLRPDRLAKDLRTLNAFLTVPERAYSSAILLIYGPATREGIRSSVWRAANRVGVSDTARQRLRLLWHPSANSPAVDLGAIEGNTRHDGLAGASLSGL